MKTGPGCCSFRTLSRRCDRQSAKTMRPSMSVLPTRTRFPAWLVMISSATYASGPIEFLTHPSSTSTRKPRVSSLGARAHARMKPAAAAAPHLSLRMPAIAPPAFTSAPPVSYVTPLPATQIVRIGLPSPLQDIRTTQGRCLSTDNEARATAESRGYSVGKLSSMMSTFIPAGTQASFTADANLAGVIHSGSADPMSLAKHRPSSKAAMA
mmetsp:Transcript_10786/g.28542  ORF Transcript_10786/g.28542 Transcript_10786/m.28542 type:complete len:210 (+) Transcript_10786:100-729(+)